MSALPPRGVICGLGPHGYELALEALASLIEAESGETRRMKVGAADAPLAPDADLIRALAGLLSETGLSEIEYAVGDHRIRVARESAGKAVRGERPRERGHANGARITAAADAGETAEAAPASPACGSTIPALSTAPLVGIAYLAPAARRGAVRPGRRPIDEGPDVADHRGDEGDEPDPRAARRPARPHLRRATPSRSNTARR